MAASACPRLRGGNSDYDLAQQLIGSKDARIQHAAEEWEADDAFDGEINPSAMTSHVNLLLACEAAGYR